MERVNIKTSWLVFLKKNRQKCTTCEAIATVLKEIMKVVVQGMGIMDSSVVLFIIFFN